MRSESFGNAILATVLLASLAACDGRRQEAGHEVESPRIVIFAPGLTTIVFDMGLGNHVAGVDQHSRPPEGWNLPVVGNALSVRVEPVLAAKPDVLLVNMDPKQFEPITLVDPSVRVEHFDLKSLEDVALAMERIARIVREPEIGRRAAAEFRSKLEQVRRRAAGKPRPRVTYVVGYDFPLAPGRGDFIDDMIRIAGGENVMAAHHEGWKKPSIELIVDLDPRVIICQCPRQKASEALAYWRALEIPKGGQPRRVHVVTDPLWTQPSGRLADFAQELLELLHPELATRKGKP